MDGKRGQRSTYLEDTSNITGNTAVEMAQKELFSSLSFGSCQSGESFWGIFE